MENNGNTNWKENYQNMKFSKIISCSWSILLKNSKILISANLIVAIIVWFLNSDIFFNFIIPIPNLYSYESLNNIKNILSISGEFLNGLFYILFFYLYYIAIIKNENGKSIQFKDFILQKKYLPRIIVLNILFFLSIVFAPVYFFLKIRPDLCLYDFNTILQMFDFFSNLNKNFEVFSDIFTLRLILSYVFVYYLSLNILLDFSMINLIEENFGILKSLKNAILLFLKNIFTVMFYNYCLILIIVLTSLITFSIADFLLFPLASIFQIILYKKIKE